METLKNVKMMMLAMQRYPWEQGVCAQAFLESGDSDIAIQLAYEAVHRQSGDGRPAMLGDSNTVTDPVSCGEVILYAKKETGDPFFESAKMKLDKWVDQTGPRSSNGILYHVMDAPEFWVDSFYMLPPYLAANGKYDEAIHQINGYWDALFLKEKQLLAHIYDEGNKSFKRNAVWGVGNGWAISGMARVIAKLPESMKEERDELVRKIKIIIDAAMKFQHIDGLFHDVLDDESTFLDTNFAQMLAYTIYRGVNAGWLESSYLSKADKMREIIHSKIDKYGVVQDVCGAPHFDKAGSAVEGQAFYILMEAAYNNKKWPNL